MKVRLEAINQRRDNTQNLKIRWLPLETACLNGNFFPQIAFVLETVFNVQGGVWFQIQNDSQKCTYNVGEITYGHWKSWKHERQRVKKYFFSEVANSKYLLVLSV
jgi:hypothetical protein